MSLALKVSGYPYVAYKNHAVPFTPGATVQKYNGTSWELVGNVGFSAGDLNDLSLAIDVNGSPYVAYQDLANSSKLTVQKFNGSSWELVGSAGFTAGPADNLSFAIDDNGTPYVTYQDGADNNKLVARKFNGSAWEIVDGFQLPHLPILHLL